mmetsp:Transcript_7009/g.18154  ORF Transcript_7009/g.18154 Transcript_7009/m.18154 type:complete len:268 (+) Transcript_7009:391-1194(+)
MPNVCEIMDIAHRVEPPQPTLVDGSLLHVVEIHVKPVNPSRWGRRLRRWNSRMRQLHHHGGCAARDPRAPGGCCLGLAQAEPAHERHARRRNLLASATLIHRSATLIHRGIGGARLMTRLLERLIVRRWRMSRAGRLRPARLRSIGCCRLRVLGRAGRIRMRPSPTSAPVLIIVVLVIVLIIMATAVLAVPRLPVIPVASPSPVRPLALPVACAPPVTITTAAALASVPAVVFGVGVVRCVRVGVGRAFAMLAKDVHAEDGEDEQGG